MSGLVTTSTNMTPEDHPPDELVYQAVCHSYPKSQRKVEGTSWSDDPAPHALVGSHLLKVALEAIVRRSALPTAKSAHGHSTDGILVLAATKSISVEYFDEDDRLLAKQKYIALTGVPKWCHPPCQQNCVYLEPGDREKSGGDCSPFSISTDACRKSAHTDQERLRAGHRRRRGLALKHTGNSRRVSFFNGVENSTLSGSNVDVVLSYIYRSLHDFFPNSDSKHIKTADVKKNLRLYVQTLVTNLPRYNSCGGLNIPLDSLVPTFKWRIKYRNCSFPPIFYSLMAAIIMRMDAEEARHLTHGADEQLKALQDELKFDRRKLRFFYEHFEGNMASALAGYRYLYDSIGTLFCEYGVLIVKLSQYQRAELGNRIAAKEAETASQSAAGGKKNRAWGAGSARGAAMGRGAAVGHGAMVGRGAVIGPGAPVGRGAVMGGVAVTTIPGGNNRGYGAAVACEPATPPKVHYGVGTAAAVVALVSAVPLSLATPSSLATRNPSASPTPPVPESHLPPPVPFTASTTSTPRPTPPQASRTVKQKRNPSKKPSGPLSIGPASPASDDSGDFMLRDDLKTRGARGGAAKSTKRAV
ncbi:hypothetical protein BDK51DRAFT_38819 [Blyttiomyces helicus]|uniref:Uncharacterized protein n=1 Tax=Blyttiomyces helicus TaxID=388810 RepID=A0A4P9WAU4_9FUNG|nr:hypothetical protein BDK51DRAFT_38819 [Blyttiomyces helicus]|eukprot:RKO87366.1 hypothetical protein BDK51DRAFT_38819 [Blyttiomyces helicus]